MSMFLTCVCTYLQLLIEVRHPVSELLPAPLHLGLGLLPHRRNLLLVLAPHLRHPPLPLLRRRLQPGLRVGLTLLLGLPQLLGQFLQVCMKRSDLVGLENWHPA